jgi:hypothetical protein
VSSAIRRPAFRSLIRRRTSASRAVTLQWAKRRNLRVVSPANRRSTRFSRDELSDLQPRPVYHRKRDSVVARLTGAFADGHVDRAGGPRRQRDGDNLVALASDGQGPVPEVQAQVLDVGAGGLRDR